MKERDKAKKRESARDTPVPVAVDSLSEEARRKVEEAARVRAEEREAELQSFLARASEGPTVVIDCEWESAMSEKQLWSVVRDLSRIYGRNRKAARPVRLFFSGIRPGSAMEAALQKNNGLNVWKQRVTFLEEPYIRVFPASRLVYVTPEGEHLADDEDFVADPEAVYVMGGLNDGNALVGKSRLKADLQGIRSIRLPITEVLGVKGNGRILTVNMVLSIALARRAGSSWHEALTQEMPGRKLKEVPEALA